MRKSAVIKAGVFVVCARFPKQGHKKHSAASSHSSICIPDLGAYSPQISHEEQQGLWGSDTWQGRKQPCKEKLPSMRLFIAVLTSRAILPGSLDPPRQLDHSLHPLGHTTQQMSLLGFKTSISSETALSTPTHGKVRHILYSFAGVLLSSHPLWPQNPAKSSRWEKRKRKRKRSSH